MRQHDVADLFRHPVRDDVRLDQAARLLSGIRAELCGELALRHFDLEAYSPKGIHRRRPPCHALRRE
jgi:hypothetical protein